MEVVTQPRAADAGPTLLRARRAVRAHAATWLPLAGWCLLIAVARIVGMRLYDADPLVRIGNPPLVGAADLRAGAWALPAVGCALAALAWGPALARRLSPRPLLALAYAAALAWPAVLAVADGPGALTAPLESRYEYLHDVDRVGDPATFLARFTELLPTYATHVKGHPPGMVLLLSALDRAGLGGATVATALVLLVAALAAPAALVALRELAGAAAMRRAAPFVALAPGAIWVGTSADGLFMGVGACAVCALVLACGRRERRGDLLALAGGLLFGGLLLLTYGGVLLGAVPLAVALLRRRGRPLLLGAAAAASVLAAAAAAGFWWLDGLAATRELYAAGVASRRPYLAFLLIDAAALALATGPAVAAGLGRLATAVRAAAASRRRAAALALAALPAGALAAVALAALSGMSRGEVERIWLPFTPWLLLATAALRPRRGWLATQLGLALALQLGTRSPW